ncbi:hypothetical protein O9992_10475 [Vibrio lentus]|nr:hypothetical protein [Vibrio lentus]
MENRPITAASRARRRELFALRVPQAVKRMEKQPHDPLLRQDTLVAASSKYTKVAWLIHLKKRRQRDPRLLHKWCRANDQRVAPSTVVTSPPLSYQDNKGSKSVLASQLW